MFTIANSYHSALGSMQLYQCSVLHHQAQMVLLYSPDLTYRMVLHQHSYCWSSTVGSIRAYSVAAALGTIRIDPYSVITSCSSVIAASYSFTAFVIVASSFVTNQSLPKIITHPFGQNTIGLCFKMCYARHNY